MAQDDVLYFDKLPYSAVPVSEMRKDFGLPTTTKADYINNDFLDDLKKLYHGDLFKNLNFDYFTADTFNHKINNVNDISLFHMNIRSLNKII